MNTGSIQTVKTFYGGDTSQVDRKNPQENRKVVFSGGTVCGKNDSMAYSTTDSPTLRQCRISRMTKTGHKGNYDRGY